MAKGKKGAIVIKMVSTAKTGFYYTTQKNPKLPKLLLKKYDPVIQQHVLFKEEKITRKRN